MSEYDEAMTYYQGERADRSHRLSVLLRRAYNYRRSVAWHAEHTDADVPELEYFGAIGPGLPHTLYGWTYGRAYGWAAAEAAFRPRTCQFCSHEAGAEPYMRGPICGCCLREREND